jgi:flagellar biosynthesis protein FlhG
MPATIEENLASNDFLASEKDTPIIRKMWSIGGGKGGTGKSFFTLSLGTRLAKMSKKVIIIDADLSGANQHTLLGIRNPQCSLNDFMNRRIDNLNEVCIETSIPNLKLICGGDDILHLSNPKFSQKARILRHLNKLEADYILLDLGAGASYNVLDFFTYTQGKIVIVSPFPTSIHNAYGFVKSAIYRRFSQLFSKNDSVLGLIKRAADPGCEGSMNSIIELIAAVDKIDRESASVMSQEMEDFKIKLIVNMVKSKEDARVGNIIRTVADKYLGITVDVLKPIPFDRQVEKSITLSNPLLLNETGNKTAMSIYEVALNILKV